MNKKCKKCELEKDVSEFYSHFGMKDERLSFCKDCVKNRIRNYRLEHLEEYIKRERLKSRNQSLKPAYQNQKKEWAKKNRDKIRVSSRKWCLKNKEKRRAHSALWRGILKGLIKRSPCEICGELKVCAHHTDYSKPLEVSWLCQRHHRNSHRETF